MLGLSGCTERTLHCPLHEQWTELREHMVRMLNDRSIAALSEQVKTGQFVLRMETSPAGERRSIAGPKRKAKSRVNAHQPPERHKKEEGHTR